MSLLVSLFPDQDKHRPTVSRTSSSHASRCCSVLKTITPNVLRRTFLTPHSPKTQSFPIRSSGSPKKSCSLWASVFDVLKSRLRAKEADGNALAAVSFLELVGDAGTDDPVDPAFHDCRRLPPPVGMHNDDTVCGRDLIAMPLDEGRLHGLLGQLDVRQHRIERLLVKVMKRHLMAAGLQGLDGRPGYGVVETASLRMAEYDGELQGDPCPIPFASPA
jgi:hypothetical protein